MFSINNNARLLICTNLFWENYKNCKAIRLLSPIRLSPPPVLTIRDSLRN